MSLKGVLARLYSDRGLLPEGPVLAAAIEEHQLDFAQLLTLSLDDVKEIGFERLGPRKRALIKLQRAVGAQLVRSTPAPACT